MLLLRCPSARCDPGSCAGPAWSLLSALRVHARPWPQPPDWAAAPGAMSRRAQCRTPAQTRPGRCPEGNRNHRLPGPQHVEMKEEAAAAGGRSSGRLTARLQQQLSTPRERWTRRLGGHQGACGTAGEGSFPQYAWVGTQGPADAAFLLTLPRHCVLYKAVHGFFTSNNATPDFLLPFLEGPMDTEGDLQFCPRTVYSFSWSCS